MVASSLMLLFKNSLHLFKKKHLVIFFIINMKHCRCVETSVEVKTKRQRGKKKTVTGSDSFPVLVNSSIGDSTLCIKGSLRSFSDGVCVFGGD